MVDNSPYSYCENSIPSELLQLQLHTKHLLTNTERNNNELIQMCIEKITESIFDGSASKILDIIIENTKENELKQIHEIVKNIKLENDEQNDIKSENTTSLFCRLPVECIGYICSHLSRNDIKSLKPTCYDIGVVCLDHMTKYSFGICNFNKFLLSPQFYPNIKSFNQTLMNNNYYHPSTLLKDLYQQWQIDFCIPQQFVFMYTFVGSQNVFHNIANDINITALVSQYDKNCFLFDTRNIVYLSSNESIPIVLHKTKNVTGIDKNNLLVIQYFDIEKQCIQILQPLVIHKSVTVQTILEYIKNTFIATTMKQRVWYTKFNNILAENDGLSVCLCADNHALYTMYKLEIKMIVVSFKEGKVTFPNSLFAEVAQKYEEIGKDKLMFDNDGYESLPESFEWTEESNNDNDEQDDDDDPQIWNLEQGFVASTDDNQIDQNNDNNNDIL